MMLRFFISNALKFISLPIAFFTAVILQNS